MKQEPLHFFAEVLYKEMSCLNFLDSDFVMLNDRLAEFYGMEKPKSGDFVKVNLAGLNAWRGADSSQFFVRKFYGSRKQPIYRATWFRDRILGDPVVIHRQMYRNWIRNHRKIKT